MLVTIWIRILPKLTSRLYFCLAQECLAVTVRLDEGVEKWIKIKGNKKEDGNVKSFTSWKRGVSIFLKNKNKFP